MRQMNRKKEQSQHNVLLMMHAHIPQLLIDVKDVVGLSQNANFSFKVDVCLLTLMKLVNLAWLN